MFSDDGMEGSKKFLHIVEWLTRSDYFADLSWKLSRRECTALLFGMILKTDYFGENKKVSSARLNYTKYVVFIIAANSHSQTKKNVFSPFLLTLLLLYKHLWALMPQYYGDYCRCWSLPSPFPFASFWHIHTVYAFWIPINDSPLLRLRQKWLKTSPRHFAPNSRNQRAFSVEWGSRKKTFFPRSRIGAKPAFVRIRKQIPQPRSSRVVSKSVGRAFPQSLFSDQSQSTQNQFLVVHLSFIDFLLLNCLDILIESRAASRKKRKLIDWVICKQNWKKSEKRKRSRVNCKRRKKEKKELKWKL